MSYDIRLIGLSTDRTVAADTPVVNEIRNEVARKLAGEFGWIQASSAQVKNGKIVLKTEIDVQGIEPKPLVVTLGVDNQGAKSSMVEFHYDPKGKNIHGNLFIEQLSEHMEKTLFPWVKAVCLERVKPAKHAHQEAMHRPVNDWAQVLA